MPDDAIDSIRRGDGPLIRAGGAAMLVALAVHVVVNDVLKVMPPEAPSAEELRAYLQREADTWAVVHGLRYVAIAGLAVFAAALFARTRRGRGTTDGGWAVVGLLGAAMMLANLLITNGLETYVFFDVERLADRPELFRSLFGTTRVLFTAEIAAWAVFIGGFAAAGWRSRRLPRWIAGFGAVPAVFGLGAAVFVVPILRDDPAAWLIAIGGLAGMAWFVAAGLFLLVRGER